MKAKFSAAQNGLRISTTKDSLRGPNGEIPLRKRDRFLLSHKELVEVCDGGTLTSQDDSQNTPRTARRLERVGRESLECVGGERLEQRHLNMWGTGFLDKQRNESPHKYWL
ncbi:hypothetical protein CEXT_625051 [Caerostris extrusa]|uniref:Uncharacterized protein n=1 Tax=Caerostris extrusa TaxID=172846 RepID=A0AAV4RXN7_CAEEX|nr:hypothetical protein CEXT_625051 [Caerostris extrusa]